MRTCEACAREFKTHRGLTCPWCGYNNARGPLPRTEGSMREIEKERVHLDWNEGVSDGWPQEEPSEDESPRDDASHNQRRPR